jgi:hypothetical protein
MNLLAKKTRHSISSIIFASISPFAAANTYYISQSGTATLAASSAGSPAPVSAFNSPSNWSGTAGTSGKISPGDTVILHGTVTSPLTFQGSGTSGRNITLLFDTGAVMTAPTWGGGSLGAISITNESFLVIDGGATGTIGGYGASGSANGIIQCTANGTNLANQDNVCGVSINGSSNITVQGLLISNLFISAAGNTNGNCGTGIGVGNNGGSSGAMHDITLTNNVIHDVQNGVIFGYGPSTSNITLSFCTAYNCNWGGGAEDGNSADTLSNLVVHDCFFHDWTIWDDASDTHHHNGFYAYAESGGTISSASFYNDVVGPNFSNSPGGTNNSTSGLFLSGRGCTGVYTYTNITGVENAGEGGPADGLIFLWPGNGSSSTISGCTFNGSGFGNSVNLYGSYLTAPAHFSLSGNTFNGNTAINCFYANSFMVISSNNNSYPALKPGANFGYSPSGSSSFLTFAQWQALPFAPDALSTVAAGVLAQIPTGGSSTGGSPTPTPTPAPKSGNSSTPPTTGNSPTPTPTTGTTFTEPSNPTSSSPPTSNQGAPASPTPTPTPTSLPQSTGSTWLTDLSARTLIEGGQSTLITGFVTTGTAPKALLIRGIGPTLQAFGMDDYLPDPKVTLIDSTGNTLDSIASWNPDLSPLFAQVGAFGLIAGSSDAAIAPTLAPGSYTAEITSSNSNSGVALAEVYDVNPGDPVNRLVNLSARTTVGSGTNVLIGGFIVGGIGSEALVIRAAGPGLSFTGLSNVLANPILTIYDSAGRIIDTVTGWGTGGSNTVGPGFDPGTGMSVAPGTTEAFSKIGAFPFMEGSNDDAVIITLPPGAYTAEVASADGSTGIALVELYEL